jgi:hypothetical protein
METNRNNSNLDEPLEPLEERVYQQGKRNRRNDRTRKSRRQLFFMSQEEQNAMSSLYIMPGYPLEKEFRFDDRHEYEYL